MEQSMMILLWLAIIAALAAGGFWLAYDRCWIMKNRSKCNDCPTCASPNKTATLQSSLMAREEEIRRRMGPIAGRCRQPSLFAPNTINAIAPWDLGAGGAPPTSFPDCSMAVESYQACRASGCSPASLCAIGWDSRCGSTPTASEHPNMP